MPLGRHVGFEKNGRDRADWLACGAVSAGRWVYVHLLLIGATLNTVNGTNINAGQLFRANARLTYYVGQNSLLRSASFLEVLSVHRSEVLPLLGQIVLCENRLDRASRLARATIDALIGMDV
jgi:hypothetical protein